MENIVANTGRYSKLFSEAIDQSSPEPSGDVDQVSRVVLFFSHVIHFLFPTQLPRSFTLHNTVPGCKYTFFLYLMAGIDSIWSFMKIFSFLVFAFLRSSCFVVVNFLLIGCACCFTILQLKYSKSTWYCAGVTDLPDQTSNVAGYLCTCFSRWRVIHVLDFTLMYDVRNKIVCTCPRVESWPVKDPLSGKIVPVCTLISIENVYCIPG